MNGLTLKMLRKAIHVIKTSKRFQRELSPNVFAGSLQVLQIAEMYMLGELDQEPQDPREVLVEIGYRI